ncbi:MAG: ABC transporter permease, partial [Ignavibacteriaceae bacterium]|nr:ABC transporter permease [Ignavibacteriaceae bacterium]
MIFERFIARRYLISKHKINFITIISIISVLGITIGVAALIVVLSVFNGFGSLVKSFLVTFDPHVRVEILSAQQDELRDEALSAINKLQNIKGYSPFVSGRVLAVRGDEMEVITLKGLDANAAENIYGIKENIMFGSYGFNENEKTPGILLGLALADRLETITGDTITIISPAGIEKSITQFALPMMQKYVVKGIFSSNNNEYDRNYIFASLNTA